MLIKINQLTKPAQATRWQSKMDIAGICIGRGPSPQEPWLPMSQAMALRANLAEFPVSIALNPGDRFDPAEVEQCIADLRADYYEYTPIDFAKPKEFAAELARISNIKCKKIANGFFIQSDDCGFIDDEGPYLEMIRAGVALFQFEVNSAVDNSFKLSKQDLARSRRFFESVPTLIADRIQGTASYPISEARGFFFNITSSSSTQNYDYSTMQTTESDIMRILSRQ